MPCCNEYICIRTIILLLLAPVRRWRILAVKSLLASSLPRPHLDLIGSADRLVWLSLGCIIDDCPLLPIGPARISLHTPALQSLTMTGAHFRASYVAPLSQLPPTLDEVILIDYSMHLSPFPFSDLLRCLLTTPLERLVLVNLHLKHPPDDALPESPYLASSVEFVDMDGDIVSKYDRLNAYVEDMSIKRCARPTIDLMALPDDPYRNCLKLEDLPDAEALLYHLAFALGPVLWLANFAWLTRDILLALNPPLDGEDMDPAAEELYWALGLDPASKMWMCRAVGHLRLEGLPLLGSAGVRAFLEPRHVCHASVDFVDQWDADHIVMSVQELSVRGCGALRQEDKEWFDKNVERVVWDNWRGGNTPSMPIAML